MAEQKSKFISSRRRKRQYASNPQQPRWFGEHLGSAFELSPEQKVPGLTDLVASYIDPCETFTNGGELCPAYEVPDEYPQVCDNYCWSFRDSWFPKLIKAIPNARLIDLTKNQVLDAPVTSAFITIYRHDWTKNAVVQFLEWDPQMGWRGEDADGKSHPLPANVAAILPPTPVTMNIAFYFDAASDFQPKHEYLVDLHSKALQLETKEAYIEKTFQDPRKISPEPFKVLVLTELLY